MSPLDSLKKNNHNKIYQPSSRVNFLADQSLKNEIEDRPKAENLKTIRPEISQLQKPPIKKYTILKIVLIGLLLFLISAAMYFSEQVFSRNGGPLSDLNKFNPFSRLARLVISGDKIVDGELDDRVNILAMGMGGEGHDGPYLTDTIIVISIKPSTGEIGMISIPRDMFVPFRDGYWYKINALYSMGRTQSHEQGVKNIVGTVENILDAPIHYYAMITFDGFENFIDEIGGVNVEVPTGFTDYQYPTKDYKVQTISFSAGSQLMDGATALMYARSRHGNNFEGSDFARSRRQQLILQAVKDKIFKFSTLLSPQKISAILDLLGNSVYTDMSIWQAIKITNMVKETTSDQIYRITLDDAPDSLLEPGITPEGAWVLRPKANNYEALARQFDNIFDISQLQAENATIEVLNGTETEGLAYWTNVFLAKLGFQIFSYDNAPTKDYERTVLYELTADKKKTTLSNLLKETNAYLAKDIPTFLLEKYPESSDEQNQTASLKPDFVLILGNDYAETFKLPVPKEEQTATSTAELENETTASTTPEIFE